MILSPDDVHIIRAAEEIRRGGLVIFPTETVYGLGGSARNDDAVAKIFQAKGRPSFNPLIIHYHDIGHAAADALFDQRAEKLAARFWPGPLTLVLPRRPDCSISRLACAGLDSLAIRVPVHDVARKLLFKVGLPLAAPSANLSGRLSPTTSSHVDQFFPDLPILDGGPCEIGLESTVVSLLGGAPSLLRSGFITKEELQGVLGAELTDGTRDKAIRSPGQLLRHYAPQKPLRLNVRKLNLGESLLAFGPPPYPGEAAFNLSPSQDLTEAAANLFRMLHDMDRHPDVLRIAVMPIPNHGLGLAINDRLARAISS